MNRSWNYLFEKMKKKKKSTLLNSTPPTFSPSLVFRHGKKDSEQIFFTLSNARWYPRCVPEMSSATSVTCCHGWLLMLSLYTPCPYYLFNPVSFEKIDLPPLRISFPLRCGVITSSPTKSPKNCVVVLISNDSCMFCSLTASRWIHQELEPEEKQENKVVRHVLSATCCEGKVYIISYSDVIVIEFDIGHRHSCDTPSAIITIHEMDRPKISMPNTRRSACYMVESCGDIFLVQKMNLGDTNIIQSLDVFKLDLSAELCWIKVETLGDRIFLLGKPSTSVSVSATQLGLQGDNIFFFHQDETYLYKFDMDSASITVTKPCPNIVGEQSQPYWLLPDDPNRDEQSSFSFVMRSGNVLMKPPQVTETKDPQKKIENEMGILNDLPEEIICYISTYLLQNRADLQNLVDYIYFRFTCKTLMSILLPLCSGDTNSNRLIPFAAGSQQLPWLMSISKRNFKGKFHHPVNNQSFTHDFSELAGAVIHHSKYGWLLMSDETDSFFFFNPITRAIIRLPGLPWNYNRSILGLSFSSPPTSNYIVLGHRQCFCPEEIELIFYRSGQPSWETYYRESKESFNAAYCNCVFSNGFFYCLDIDGKLGVFNTKTGLEDDSVWRVLPNVIGPKKDMDMDMDRLFLVECEGEILSVFIGGMCSPICVFKLERLGEKMKWVKLDNLGDKMIFLSFTTSILARAESKAMKNKIFLPIFCEKEIVFYSLSTKKYHSIGCSYSRDDWMNTYAEFRSTWIELDAMEVLASKESPAS